MSDLGASAKLDMGRVIQQLFAVLGRNFATFAILSLILTGIPAVIVGFLQLTYLKAGSLFAWQSFIGSVVAGLAALILQGTIIYGTVTDLNGRRPNLADSLSVGLRSFLPVLGIGIVWYLAIFCGMVLLIVPGLMILVAWAVSIPAYVAERPSLAGAFSRSAQLTRGNRWRILGLLLLYFIVLIIIEALFGVFNNAGRVAAGGSLPVLQTIVFLPLLGVANALVGAVGAAVLYVELRRIKDGVGAESLAAIFD